MAGLDENVNGEQMTGRVIALFIIVPLIEMAILIEIGQRIGTWKALFLVIITGLIGGILARLEGLEVWRRLQDELARGQVPQESLVSGLLVLIGGVLLITPGLITDIVGFLLLIPITRRLFLKPLKKKFASRVNTKVIEGEKVTKKNENF